MLYTSKDNKDFDVYLIVCVNKLYGCDLCSMKHPRKPKRTNETLTEAVARRLKQLRVESGFSQEYVGENTRLNMSRTEAGTTNITIVTLETLCHFYGVTLREFVEGME